MASFARHDNLDFAMRLPFLQVFCAGRAKNHEKSLFYPPQWEQAWHRRCDLKAAPGWGAS
jgi:hypothetical protein